MTNESVPVSPTRHLALIACVVVVSCTVPNKLGPNGTLQQLANSSPGTRVDDKTLGDDLAGLDISGTRATDAGAEAAHKVLGDLFGEVSNFNLPDMLVYFRDVRDPKTPSDPTVPVLSYRDDHDVRVLSQEAMVWAVVIADRLQPGDEKRSKDPYGRDLYWKDRCPYARFRLTGLGQSRSAPVLTVTDLLKTALSTDKTATKAATPSEVVTTLIPVNKDSHYCWAVQGFSIDNDSFDRVTVMLPYPKDADSKSNPDGAEGGAGAKADACCCCASSARKATPDAGAIVGGADAGAPGPAAARADAGAVFQDAAASSPCLQPSCDPVAAEPAKAHAEDQEANQWPSRTTMINFANSRSPLYSLSVAFGSDLYTYRTRDNHTWCWIQGGCVPSLYVFAHLHTWYSADEKWDAQPYFTFAFPVIGVRVLDPALSEVVAGFRAGFGEGAKGVSRVGLVGGAGYGLPSVSSGVNAGNDFRLFAGLDYAF